MLKPAVFVALSLALAGCAVAGTPVQVTRFHLGMPVERAGVLVVAGPGIDANSLETKSYLDAVQAALIRNGFSGSQPDAKPPLLASVSFSRTIRELEPAQKPVTIGLGLGGFGGNVGGSASTSFGVGKRQTRSVYVTLLAVQLRNEATGTVMWEGRAQTESKVNATKLDGEPNKLASALFKGFPGESGRTIKVK